MILLRNSKFRINMWITISYFLIAVSYFDSSYRLENIKLIGIAILDYIALEKVIKTTLVSRSHILFIGGVFLYLLMASLLAGDMLNSMINILLYSIELGVIVYYSNKVFSTTDCILSATIGNLIAMILGLFLKPQLLLTQRNYAYGRIRLFGVFGHPNTLGCVGMVVFIGGFIYWFLKHKKRIIDYILWGMISVFSICGVILSDSRNALYGTIIFLYVFLALELADKLLKTRTLKMLIFLLLAIGMGYFILHQFDLDDLESLNNRVSSIYLLSDLSPRIILIGNGLSGSGDIGLGWGAEFSLTQIIYKVGVVGLLFFMDIFIILWNRNKKNGALSNNIFVALLLMFFVCCVAEPYIVNITNVFPMFFWILLSAFSQWDESQIEM